MIRHISDKFWGKLKQSIKTEIRTVFAEFLVEAKAESKDYALAASLLTEVVIANSISQDWVSRVRKSFPFIENAAAKADETTKTLSALFYSNKLRVFDFLCPGAPKSGTSFLYSLLREHPDVYMGPKDIVSFDKAGQRDWVNNWKNQLREYNFAHQLGLFDASIFANTDWLECSLHMISPNGKVLFCHRDPVDRALSEWKMRLLQFDMSGRPREFLHFKSALEQSTARKIQNPTQYYLFNAYIENGSYPSAFDLLTKSLKKDQIMLISFERQIKQNVLNLLKDVEAFLSISPYFNESNISQVSENAKLSSKTFQSIAFSFTLIDGTVSDRLDDNTINALKGFEITCTETGRTVKQDITRKPWSGLATYPEYVSELLRTRLTLEEKQELQTTYWPGSL